MDSTIAADRDAASIETLARAFLKSPEFRQEWRGFYDLLYTLQPIPLGNGEWLIAGRDDVVSAMRVEGSELTALYPATRSPVLNELFLGMLPFEQGDQHRRLRGLTRGCFSTKAVAVIHEHIAAMLDRLLYPAVFDPAGCDVLSTLGVRIPEAVSCLLIDADPEDWSNIGRWARDLYAQLGRYDQSPEQLSATESTCAEFVAYVRRRMAGEARAATSVGVGDALITAWRAGQLDDKQLISYFALFLFTGLDTLTYAIGNSLWLLGHTPALFEQMRSAPACVDAAFDEAMRLWGPIRLCVRHLQRPATVSSGTLPAGSLVFLLIHAANRDPRRIEEPDRVWLGRRRTEDLAFGVGAHGCLGTAVGKLVGRSLFRAVVSRCRSLHVTPGPANPSFIPSLPFLGVKSVRVFAEPA